jgi:hypothetical protein
MSIFRKRIAQSNTYELYNKDYMFDENSDFDLSSFKLLQNWKNDFEMDIYYKKKSSSISEGRFAQIFEWVNEVGYDTKPFAFSLEQSCNAHTYHTTSCADCYLYAFIFGRVVKEWQHVKPNPKPKATPKIKSRPYVQNNRPYFERKPYSNVQRPNHQVREYMRDADRYTPMCYD